jgi:NADH:ubiquinone reductase (H+-translocating)
MNSEHPHVVILGAGFGGLSAARALKGAPVRVTVVDKRNHHLFQPLLYQVATAGLAATDIAAPTRVVLKRQKNATVVMARATAVDTSRKVVVLQDGELAYDYLILAAGMTNSYFGHDEWAEHAPGLKSLEEALDIRRRILLAYEAAERETDDAARQALLTFVVIGGGPTGVELAGALQEIAQRTMAKNFRNFDPTSARVLLIEGGPRLLGSFPEDASASALAQLRHLGVDVRLNTRARHIDTFGVKLDGEHIAAHTVLWGAGVAGVPIAKTLGVATDRAGRVPVESTLAVKGVASVFAIGDLAALEQDGEQLPGVAQNAIQGGRIAAANVIHAIRGEPLMPYRYNDLGSMATIGRSHAVVVIGKFKFSGVFAWITWLFVHLMALVGYRNRLVVFLEWAFAYVSFNRSARIILERPVPRTDAAPVSRANLPRADISHSMAQRKEALRVTDVA